MTGEQALLGNMLKASNGNGLHLEVAQELKLHYDTHVIAEFVTGK